MRKCLLLLLLCLLPPSGYAQREVLAWTYHLIPPFILDRDNQQGLSYDLLELFNLHPENRGRFRFRLVYQPRKRLDLNLQRRQVELLLWVNPVFLDAAHCARSRWTPALLQDQQEFLSRAGQPFDYDGPASLHGRTLGGVLGHRYQPIEADIDRGLIQRKDVLQGEQNLNKLLSKRLDLILLPRSTALFYSRRMGLNERLHFSAKPLNSFSRHLLLQPSLDRDVAEFVTNAVASLEHNPEWRRLLQRYGLD
jgi:polar amino acid transport system substrate-binding protein